MINVIIDCHDCQVQLDNFLIELQIQSTVQLIECADLSFEFCVDYTYSGDFVGNGHLCVPVNGNDAQTRNEGHGIFIDYAVKNWNVTDQYVGCDLSVSARYTPLDMGGNLLENKRFEGSRLVASR